MSPSRGYDASQIRMQPLLELGINKRLAMLGAKDDVKVEPSEGVRHAGLRERNEALEFRVF